MKSSNGWKCLMTAVLAVLVPALILPGCAKTQQVLTRESSAQPPSLEGRWELKEYGPSGSLTPVLPETRVFAVFTPDGKISGSGGCNRYFGGWAFVEGEPNILRIWRTGSTKMACPVPVMIQEHRFLEELGRASSYLTDGRELRLYYDSGKGVLRFSRDNNP